ncbi:MAG: DUF4131 domain-containing protein [Alphaproteobacteria bacterium]|nr:DUF4131 domain-containing protein [Alphaproteobacteria bacterium]
MPREPDSSLNRIDKTGRQSHGVRVNVLSWVVEERSRWILWCPVFLACGIAVYFQLSQEPAIWVGPVLISILTSGWIFISAIRRNTIVFLIFLIPVLGFTSGQLRTYLVSAPVLEKKTGPIWVNGIVNRWEPKARGHRVTLSEVSIDLLMRHKTPSHVRITIKGDSPIVRAGDKLRIRAVLYPPAAPAMPGAFDFSKQAFFKRLGAVGYAVRKPELLRQSEDNELRTAIARLRQTLTERILRSLPGTTGGFAAALITGERGRIPDDVLSAMRESGLAHLLAISGLHIGLVAGILFFVCRFLLSLVEPIAIRWPIKKWAAGMALFGSFFYLLISGMTLPTQRAFLMLSLALLAVMIDRRAISMQMVAWAGCAILAIVPESLFNVSFQMSFAAVIALVAVYERGSFLPITRAMTPVFRLTFYIAGVLLTTVVASLATAPFALFHFNQVALYSMLANVLAVPITGLWIMPFAIVAVVLMPFDLENYPLMAMGSGIEAIVSIARFVQELPGAVYAMSAMNGWLLSAIALGGLWLCLWQHTVRYLGMVPIVIALVMLPGVPIPDVFISASGNQIAVRDVDGRLFFIKGRKGIVIETWLRRTGNRVQNVSQNPKIENSVMRCDGLGCVFYKNGQQISLLWHPAAILEDCSMSDIIVATIPVSRPACQTSENVIDRFDLWRNGNHVVFLDRDRVTIKSIGSTAGRRPWSRYPREFKKQR